MGQFNRQRIAKATYSFATDGGAISTITPSISDIIPANAIITAVYTDVTTTVTSGGSATVAVNAGATVIVTAATLSTLVWNSTAKTKQTLAASATAIKPSAAGRITLTVAVAALTAGVVNVYVEYIA